MDDIRQMEWFGDHAVFLVHRRYEFWKEKREFSRPDGTKYRKWVQLHDRHSTIIDMNEKGWTEKHKELLRTPGVILLCSKDRIPTTGVSLPIAILRLEEEEQAFCKMHPVNLATLDGSQPIKSIRTWVLGKKTYKGTTEAVCVFPNGIVTSLADVDGVGDYMNKGYL